MTVEEYDEMLRAEGRAEGKAEGIADSVRNLAECGFSDAEIARMLKLPEGEVSDILEK